ncbi:MAG: aminotransferase class V-fold PLP-dependent enzyme [Gemmatimonadota bacterium]|nr:aminotransferase class V-fold PLP-dependent enzyme [Gemmatimonadota bacterium]MDE3004602.1 aminotransferase class V-fold PLP-dependent enzyme [Gemmatimonadota bacterium]MDE3014877.1 aminotransferase class V-fold PLP-dependent enzyme [Gemmatimonadota bacterium]
MNEQVRALFPGASERTYLNIAAKGLIPHHVRDVVHAYLDDQVGGTSDKDVLREQVDQTRAMLASMIGAEADEVAITKNVSEGLNLFAASLEWRAGDNVVICPELEHPNNIYLWFNLARRYGVHVRSVEPVDGMMPTEGMVAAIDDRTRIVTFPTISFAPGFLTDIEPIVRAARAAGAWTLADGAQSIGSLETDVHALGIDALAVATQKCLLSLYGFGFLYVRREVAEQLVPIHVARYGIALDAHETAYSDGPLEYASGARRFDLGNYNYLGMSATKAALELVSDVGVDRIEKHVRGLAADLANGLMDLGMPVVGGRPGVHLAHIVSSGHLGSGRHYSADDPEVNALHRHLVDAGIVFSLRSGVLRFSFGLYNDTSDVEHVLSSVRAFQEKGAVRS